MSAASVERPARRRRSAASARRVREAPPVGSRAVPPRGVAAPAEPSAPSARPRPRPRPRPVPAQRPAAPSRSAASGRAASLPNGLVVVLVGLLLGVIVALQVGALRANMESGEVRRDTRRVQNDVANLNAEIASLTTDERIGAAARRLGMVVAPSEEVRAVRVPRARAAR